MVWVTIEEVAVQAYVVHSLNGPVGPLLKREIQEVPEGLGDDLPDRLARVERGVGVLKYVLDPLQHRLWPLPRAGGKANAIEDQLAGPVAVQARDAPGQGRFA